eukprot:1149851-Pelagomonas_calceolata.AAC.1
MHMPFTLLEQCLNTCTWTFPITFFTTRPDSGCGFTLYELKRLFGPMALLRSVISVMTYKMKNMCCSDVPIPSNSSTVGLNTLSAISERAVDACPNFLFAILDMTAAISERPCPPVRDFEYEGWVRLVRYEEFFVNTFVWFGRISRSLLLVKGETLALSKSRQTRIS